MSHSFSPEDWVVTRVSNALISKGAVLQVLKLYPAKDLDSSDLILASTGSQVALYEPQELKLWESPL